MPFKKKYDLPFKKNKDGKFIILLIALMSFLLVIALYASLIIHRTADKWSSGLENKATIEITPISNNGAIISKATLDLEIKKIKAVLDRQTFIKSYENLSEEEIRKLVSPWLGHDLGLENITLPRIISLELYPSTEEQKKELSKEIASKSDFAKLDLHYDWLNKIIIFVKTLKVIAILTSILVGIITVLAIAMSINSKIKIYKKEVEILHLMGASDAYISSQFVRYTAHLSLYGSILGTVSCIFILLLTTYFSYQNKDILIPDISLNINEIIFIIMVPISITIISMLTARQTVLRYLALFA